MRKLSILLAVFALASQLNAQTYQDAYRISQYGVFGTASYMGRAGAIGALGGDFTAASYNPAGLGVYYRSDVFLSTSLHIGNTDAKYNGSANNDFRTSFYWLPIGLVLAVPTEQPSGWKAFQFSIGANRLTPFNRGGMISGNSASSITDLWVIDANEGYFPTDVQLAEETGVLFTDSLGNYYSSFPPGNVSQSKYTTEYGGIDELALSVSANYNDFLYLGATLGVPFADYEIYSQYKEKSMTGNIFNGSFDYEETISTTGVGVNLKLGAIVRPIEWLRVGLGFHTPTFYSLHDEWFSDMSSSYSSYPASSDLGLTDYYLTTPYKALASLGTTFGDQYSKIGGSLGIDYEYTDYGFMQYSGGTDVQWKSVENKQIADIYKAGHTFRIGGTLNIQQMAIRLGYALWTTPYKTDYRDYDKNTFTAGIGYKSKFWYIDFAYAFSQQKSDYVMYPYDPMPVAKLTKNENLFIITTGWRF